MILALIAALLLGVLTGTITGLTPGIHINLVAAGLLASIGYFSENISVLGLAVFIVAMSITHTFIDFVPAVFLGAPEEDSFLSVLPGHELLREGKGFEAVVLTLYGSLVALGILILSSFVFIFSLESIYGLVKTVIPFILIFVSFYLIFREERVWGAGIVFVLAGFLGLFAFNLPVKEPLLPLLSGLFGISGLLVSLKQKVTLSKQTTAKLKEIKLGKRKFWKGTLAAALASPLCSFLPGIGSGHAAVMGSEIFGDIGRDKRGFLFLVGAINTIVMGLSFVTLYVIGKGRTGSAVAVGKLLGKFSFSELAVLLGAGIVAGGIAFFLGIMIAKIFALGIGRINYSKLSLGVMGIVFLVNMLLSNWVGLIVLITGSALGVFAILSGVRRIQMMGCLLIPSVVFYLFG